MPVSYKARFSIYEAILCLSVAHHRCVRPAVQALLHLLGKQLQKAGFHELGTARGNLLQVPRFLLCQQSAALFLYHRRRPNPAPGFLEAPRADEIARPPLHHPRQSVPSGRRSVRAAESLRVPKIPALAGRHGAHARLVPQARQLCGHAGKNRLHQPRRDPQCGNDDGFRRQYRRGSGHHRRRCEGRRGCIRLCALLPHERGKRRGHRAAALPPASGGMRPEIQGVRGGRLQDLLQ